MKKQVIFLIDSPVFERQVFSLTLEKYTNCKIFNFFSFEEAILYRDLNPSLVIHDNTKDYDLSMIGNDTQSLPILSGEMQQDIEDETELALKLATKIRNSIKSN